MAVQKFNIKEIVGDSELKKTTKSTKKDSGGILGGLAQTGMAALPFVPKKYIAIGVVSIFIFLYGAGSIIIDIINLF